MFRILLVLALTLPSMASALSCRPPNYGALFNEIAAAPELYHLATGVLRAAEPVPRFEDGEPRRVAYVFEGSQMTGGARWPEGQRIEVQTTCASVWCGNLPPTDTELFLFVRDDPASLTVMSDPCSSYFMVKPTLGQRTALRACLRGGGCGPEEMKVLNYAER